MIRARFFVAGEPTTQGSKRIVQPKGHRRAILIEMTAHKLALWREAIAGEAIRARMHLGCTLTGPLRLEAGFRCWKPKRPVNSYPRLDLDKLARALLDGLCTDGLLAGNDAQFTTLVLRKRYVAGSEEPGCSVVIEDDE